MAKERPQTGGLQEKKIKVEPTKEEIKQEQKAAKEKRAKKVKERRKERVGFIARIRDMFGELKKVRWPTLAHTIKQTGVVLGVVVVFALIIFAIDSGLGQLFKILTRGLSE